MNVYLFWQLVFVAVMLMFGWLSLRPRFLWSEWPRICMWASYFISLIFMVLVLSGSK